jgi:hypothetical protein
VNIEIEVPYKVDSSSLTAVLFSMNRAMQLDAVLRSLYRHCWDADQFDLYMIYKTTSPTHTRQYQELIQEYQPFERIHFIRQLHFRFDLLSLLFDAALPDRSRRFFKAATRLGGMFGRFTRSLLKPDSATYVLFLVDDNIFTGDFFLGEVINVLNEHPEALGFSLRLGENTQICYAHDQPQALPQFEEITPGVLKFDWTKAEHDFHYPLEVSSSIYRCLDLLPLINSRSFGSPNELEEKMAASSAHYKDSHPWLLCYSPSVTFCNPVNRVQNGLLNRAGVDHDYPVESLANMYDAGYRIDVAAYDDFISTGCHQEVELQLTRNES